jgi:hypothetical protein
MHELGAGLVARPGAWCWSVQKGPAANGTSTLLSFFAVCR